MRLLHPVVVRLRLAFGHRGAKPPGGVPFPGVPSSRGCAWVDSASPRPLERGVGPSAANFIGVKWRPNVPFRQQGCSFLEATPSPTFGPTPICHMKSIRSDRVFAFLQSASEKTYAVQHQKCLNCVFGASNDCICTSCDHERAAFMRGSTLLRQSGGGAD